MPKRSRSQAAGFRGEAFAEKVVVDMGFLWHPRPRDFGIDGEIEVVDRDNQVTGAVILAQVKGTSVGFPGGNSQTIRYQCESDHVDYWMRQSRPVILICVDLIKQKAWWKRVDSWFSDPGRRARGVVEFDIAADYFDGAATASLTEIATPVGQVPPRIPGTETLVSSLLTIERFGPQIHSASTPYWDRGDAWERMRSNGAFEGGFLLSGGRIYSMTPLEGSPLSVLCDGPVESFPTNTWSETTDRDLRRRFVTLLNFTLRAAHYRELVWHQRRRIVYYAASSDLKPRKIKGLSPRSRGRAFFSLYYGKDDVNKVRYCRHYAAKLIFCCWDGQWFLDIIPTYHYTIDGRRDSLFEAEYLKGIKLLEKNAAVLGLVRAWADFLVGEDSLFASRDERIIFGKLATLEADAAINEKAWAPPRMPEHDGESGDQLDLFDGSRGQ